MAYEDIYKGLTEDQKEQMIKADIPKAVVIGEFKMSEEEKKKADKRLMDIIQQRKQYNQKEKSQKDRLGEVL